MPARFVTTGVGSRPGDDENPLAAVRSPRIGGGYDKPFRIEPETGQVSEYSAECPQRMFASGLSQTPRAGFHIAVGSGTEQSSHVLQHYQRRPQDAGRAGDVRPDPGPVALAKP